MKKAKQILMKAFDIKLANGRAVETGISHEEYEYAMKKGIMFPYTEVVPHDECLRRITAALSRITSEDAANSFLYSLSTRALEYRSVLGSYWYAKSIPPHENSNKNCKTSCYTCKWSSSSGCFTKKEYDNYSNVFSYERYKYGGVRHASTNYALFDLEEFLKLPKIEHSEKDEQILYDILSIAKKAEPHVKASGLRKAVTAAKILRSNANELDVILDILGICGILESPEHRCYDECFMECINRDPPELTNDHEYPVSWWKAEYGINKQRLDIVFGNTLKTVFDI